jgi:capsular exopolysaccharide synthesis family protein
MSQIFDALQRSEAERSGKDPVGAARATELLRSAESFVESRRGNRKAPDDWIAGDKASDVAVEELPPQVPPARSSTDATTVPPKEQHAVEPREFETLRISSQTAGNLVCLREDESLAGEAFSLLGVRLRHLRRQRPLKRLLITSSIPQEGKSMVAANLACALGLKTQQKVLLLEGDVRRPTQSKIFGIQDKPGICECLRGERKLAGCIYELEGPGIWILPAGFATGNSLELLQSGKLNPLMDQLSEWFDWIVVDSPPILPLADTSVWTSLVDGILLVTRQGTTQKRHLKKGLEALGTQKLIGALLNSSKGVTNTDYYYRPTNGLRSDVSEG